MTPTLRTLLLAAGAAATLSASAARACDDLPLAGTPPAYLPAPPAPAWGVAPAHWRRGDHWARSELEREYWVLDRTRDRFHRRWGWNPWRVARFEAWYSARRAELDQRSAALDRGRGWGWER